MDVSGESPALGNNVEGFSPTESQSSYAGISHAHPKAGRASAGACPVPSPGKDCLQKAAEFEASSSAKLRSVYDSLVRPKVVDAVQTHEQDEAPESPSDDETDTPRF